MYNLDLTSLTGFLSAVAIIVGAHMVLKSGRALFRAWKSSRPVLRVQLVDPRAKPPHRANPFAAGFDLFILEDSCVPGNSTKILGTGVAMEIPPGYFGMVRPRGSAMKRGMVIQGTIDSDYRGEVLVLVQNITNAPQLLAAGTAVAQMILTPYEGLPVVETDDLSSTVRGSGRFGSTGNA